MELYDNDIENSKLLIETLVENVNFNDIKISKNLISKSNIISIFQLRQKIAFTDNNQDLFEKFERCIHDLLLSNEDYIRIITYNSNTEIYIIYTNKDIDNIITVLNL